MTQPDRVLIVSWDGAGNQVPTLGIAERLAQCGHDVRILGHSSIGERVKPRGWRFEPFEHTLPWDSVAPADHVAEMEILAREVWFGPAVARDVTAALDREPADVLVADCMLYTALIAGQSRRLPTVALFHAPVSIFRAGPLHEMLSQHLPATNELRAEFDLPPVASINEIHDGCSLSLVATPREFDVPVPLPENVRFIGPVLDGPAINDAISDLPVDAGSRQLVVVSFSTSFQEQRDRLQDVVDALRGCPLDVVITTGAAIRPEDLSTSDNVRAAAFVAHDRLLPKASVVVTHAGHGTVMAALSHGVPVVCLPMGRDQFFNAAMVERLGVGRIVPPEGGPHDIRRTVDDLLANKDIRQEAKRFAATIAKYGGATEAVRELERQ